VAEIMAQGVEQGAGRCLALRDLANPTQHCVWWARVTVDARSTLPKARLVAGISVAFSRL
jgi:hypothetical protein